MLSNEHIATILQQIAAAPEHRGIGGLRQIWLMTDDPAAPAGIAAHLDRTPDLHVTFFDLGSSNGRTCSRANLCTSVISTDLGAFLFAGFALISRARVVISNSNSNLGVLVDTLAESYTQYGTTPILVDMDLRVTTAALEQGKFWCSPEWGSRHGLCPAGLANDCTPWGHVQWHASESTADDAIVPAPCTPSMQHACEVWRPPEQPPHPPAPPVPLRPAPLPPLPLFEKLHAVSAVMSSELSTEQYGALNAIDGDLATLVVTAEHGPNNSNNWLSVRLANASSPDVIMIHNRADQYASLLDSVQVYLSNTEGDWSSPSVKQCGGLQQVPVSPGPVTVRCGGVRMPGQVHVIVRKAALGFLSLAEVEAYAMTAPTSPPP